MLHSSYVHGHMTYKLG